MSWKLGDEEFEDVRAQSSLERYAYFMQRVLDHGEVWVLVRPEDDRIGIVEDEQEGVAYMMAWPHERFADAERDGDWAAHVPRSFALEQWIEGVLPTLARDGVDVGVFPIWDRGVWSVAAADLREELLQALGGADVAR